MSSSVRRRFAAVAAEVTEHLPSRIRPLADPPPGSGLKPVMGSQGAPYVGHVPEMLHEFVDRGEEWIEEHGPVSWIGGYGGPWVLVAGPEGLDIVATNREKAFGNEGFYDFLIGPFFHRGVMLMDFEEHHHHRRIMQQAFTRDRLVGYLDAMHPAIEAGLADWRAGSSFPIYDAAKALTLDIASEVFMGERVHADAQRINKAFVDAVRGGQAYVRAPVPGGTWARGLRGRRVLEDYFRERLPAKRAGDGDDLFSVLCRAESEDGSRFSDDDIVNHMIFLMMAAHDTSTITLAMMAYNLGVHPEWQERVRAESLALGKPTLDYDDLDRLVSLDLVMKETMRLNAPVGGLFRETIKDTEVLGHYIPAGTRVMAGLVHTQRMGEWWTEPHAFDPERFADGRREDKAHRYAWAPFGGGAHKCIGMYFGAMEIKAIMHRLVQQFRWTVPAGYVPPLEYGTGPTPADGLPIQLAELA